MNTAKIIQNFTEDGLVIDLHADGDCVFAEHPHGFFVLSADLLMRIAKKAGFAISTKEPGKTKAANESSIAFETASAISNALTPFTESTEKDIEIAFPDVKSSKQDVGATNHVSIRPIVYATNAHEDLVKRRIQPVESPGKGWKCAFLTAPRSTHIYATRNAARRAKPEFEVGNNDRIG